MGGIFEHVPLGAAVVLILCIISCVDTNRYIEEKCANDPRAKDKKAPVFWLSVVALAMVLKYFIK